MTFPIDRLRRIFDKTDGYCFHCGKKLAWSNYGNLNGKAGWEVDHSIPKSRGGTNHLNNLVPSCIPCNRDKGDLTSRQYRAKLDPDTSNSDNDPLSAIIILGSTLLFLGWIIKKRQQSRTDYYKS